MRVYLYTVSHERELYFRPEIMPPQSLTMIRQTLARHPGYKTVQQVTEQMEVMFSKAMEMFKSIEENDPKPFDAVGINLDLDKSQLDKLKIRPLSQGDFHTE